ncbi:hypothetical protein AX14_010350, partial [Amanita brunnescens Koide BX004]
MPAYTAIDTLDPFVSLSDSAPRQLESLHLTWTYSSSIRFNNITTFACAPNLRKLRLGFTPPDAGSSGSSSDAHLEPSFDSYYFMVPWAQLTHLGVNLGRSAGLFSFEHVDMPALDTLQISAKPWTRNERARKFAWDGPSVAAYPWLKNLSTLIVSLQDMSTHVAGL